MEVRLADAKHAQQILEEEYLRSTGISSHDLSTADAVFDENALSTVCPACGSAFTPGDDATCPECGLSFGQRPLH
uniref:hypothetical protein n=1 Tax=Desulfopila aestuarii TaxID=231440 RepID=UPI0009369FFF|nr:hypothetical protein [Desulfopila aestuarii]